MTPAKSQEEATCRETPQYLESSIFERNDCSFLTTNLRTLAKCKDTEDNEFDMFSEQRGDE